MIKTLFIIIIVLAIIGVLFYQIVKFIMGLVKHKNISCHGCGGEDHICPNCSEDSE